MKKVDLDKLFGKNKSLNDLLNVPVIPDVKPVPMNKYYSSPQFMNPPPASALPIPNFDD